MPCLEDKEHGRGVHRKLEMSTYFGRSESKVMILTTYGSVRWDPMRSEPT